MNKHEYRQDGRIKAATNKYAAPEVGLGLSRMSANGSPEGQPLPHFWGRVIRICIIDHEGWQPRLVLAVFLVV